MDSMLQSMAVMHGEWQMGLTISEKLAVVCIVGIIALACVFIILAMCAVASDADDSTDELLKDGDDYGKE